MEGPGPRALPDPAGIAAEYGSLVTSLCRSMFRDEEAARDAAQEAWIEVLASLPGFRGESALGTWIYRVVYRRIVKLKVEGRRRSLRELRLAYRGPDFEAPDWAAPDLGLWAQETCRDCLRGLLFCLDSDSRLVFILRFAVALPYSAIAEVMGRSEEAVRQSASRARRLVSAFLRGDCGLVRRGASCRCRNERWIKSTGLAERFWRIRRAARLATLYRDAQLILPKKDFWARLIEEGRPRSAGPGPS